MKVYKLIIHAVIVCDGGEGNPAHAWDAAAIADSLADDPESSPKAHWRLESCVEMKPA